MSRNQLQDSSLEVTISADNPVRFKDAVVSSMDLEKIGYNQKLAWLKNHLLKFI